MTITGHLRVFETKNGKMIRICSTFTLNLGAENERVLNSLLNHQIAFLSRGNRIASRVASRTRIWSRGSVSIHPNSDIKQPKHNSDIIGPFESNELLSKQSTTHKLSLEERITLVEGTLELLFQSPVHKYYLHTRDMVPGQLGTMITSLIIYVSLEVLSFVMLHFALKRKFNLSALYQLAFVLETHVVKLQSRLFVWIVFILQFTLQHYGVDFTFQFVWVK
ncbi:hypothetical protein L914_02311 [Phytophthora nicotianae]|uniref:Uncharacterized protein n=1 Tax=Phytophthora nicotianae TaxID=4792 RepID=W2P0W2_PHYNI|nr:hypothetical protein L914_02311 [Phytophthora nicotianae]